MEITSQAKSFLLNKVIIDVNDSGMVTLENNTIFYLDDDINSVYKANKCEK